MVHAYASSQVGNLDLAEKLEGQWVGWLIGFAQEYGIDLDFHIQWVPLLAVEYPNLRNAIGWCHEHQRWNDLLQLSEGTYFYAFLDGRFGEFREVLDVALDTAVATHDRRRQGQFERRLGWLSWMQGRHDEAGSHLVEAEKIARERNDEVELGRTWMNQFDLLFDQDRLAEAEQRVQMTSEVTEKTGDLELRTRLNYALFLLETEKAVPGQLAELADRSIYWAKQLGWSRGEAWSVYVQGVNLLKREEFASAESLFLHSLEMATSWGERRLIAFNKRRLAQIYANTDRLPPARQTAEEARDLFERIGMPIELTEMEDLLRRLP